MGGRAALKSAGFVRRVAVTGATGFLGGDLAMALHKLGVEVIALGRHPDKLGAMPMKTVQCDITDITTLRTAFRGCDAVIHAAALSSPWGQRAAFWRSNVLGSRVVTQACQLQGVARLVYISSPAVVFADCDAVNLPDDAAYPQAFSSHYAHSKCVAERDLRASDLPCVILRPKAIYGVGDTSLLPRIVAAARAGRLPQIGDGSNLIELTHISDATRAVLLALETPLETGHPVPYTITSGERVRLWDVIRRVLGGLGVPSTLPVISLPVALRLARTLEGIALVTKREPRLTRYTAQILARTQTYDTTRAALDLGYRAEVSLNDGLEQTIAALRGVT